MLFVFTIYVTYLNVLKSNEGGEKVRNEFQSQVKKLLDEEASIPSKPIEVNEAQLPDETLINPSILPKNEEITAPIINSTVEDNSVVTIDLSVSSIEKSEEVLTVNENNTEISLPTTAVPILVQEEISQITTDSVTIIPEEVIAKKITDEESSKPGKTDSYFNFIFNQYVLILYLESYFL